MENSDVVIDLLNHIYNTLTGCCVALWFIFLFVGCYFAFKLCDYFTKCEIEKKEKLKKEILQEYERKSK